MRLLIESKLYSNIYVAIYMHTNSMYQICEKLLLLLFKPGTHQLQAGTRLVFKIDPMWIVGMRVRVCVGVSGPEAINN